MPAFDEEGNIERTLAGVVRTASRHCGDWEVVVVDDGSRDGTARAVWRLAREDPRIRLVSHPRNLGYGAALRTCLRSARLDLILFLDSDGQFDPEDLRLMVPLIESADVVVGYRSNRSDRLVRRAAARAWNRLVRALFGVPVRDVDCAFKLFRRDALRGVELHTTGAMASTELLVKLHRAGATIEEVPVAHRPRTSGRASGLAPVVVARAAVELVQAYRILASEPTRIHAGSRLGRDSSGQDDVPVERTA